MEDRNLRVVNGFAKVAKVFSMILFVLIIVSGSLTLLSLLTVLLLPNSGFLGMLTDLPAEIAQGLAALPPVVIATAVYLVIIFAAYAVTFKMSYNYYKRELRDGTPFTDGGAMQLRTLGIVKMSVSAGAALLGQIYLGIIKPWLPKLISAASALAEYGDPSITPSGLSDLANVRSGFNLGSDFWLGLAFLALSFLLAYGASLAKASEKPACEPAAAPEASEWMPVSPRPADEQH